MTKFIVTYIRTLTDDGNEIEANSLEEAQKIANAEQKRIASVDYAQSEETNEIEPKYLDECPECHDAETFDDLGRCFTCAQINHPDQVTTYIQAANERMKRQLNGCSMCERTAFCCEYIQVLRPLSPTVQCSWIIACPQCLAAIAAAITNTGARV